MTQTYSYECKGCGGPTQFDPESQNLKCEFCGTLTEFEKPNVDVEPHELEKGFEDCSTDWQQEMRVIHCDSCGAESVLESKVKAQECPFCDSPQVSNTETEAGIKPDYLIPFKVSEKNAKEGFKKWIKSKFFAQGSAKNPERVEHLKGVYVPFWLFDVDTTTNYKGRRGKVVRSRRNNKRRTRWYPVSGTYHKDLYNVSVCASTQVKDMNLSEKKIDYKYEELEGYDPAFLSGFVAERYEHDIESSWDKAKDKIKKILERGIKREIGGDKQRVDKMDTQYRDPKYKHVLCPMWISNFKHNGKSYPFIVNGQTGETEGKYPLSYPKVAGAVAAVAGILYVLL